MSDHAYSLFVGIDVSAASVSVSWQPRDASPCAPLNFQQTRAERDLLVAKVRATGHDPAQTLVVIEATSTYWMQLALFLHEARFCVSIINPMQAHGFARALLKRAKTDAIDAQTLAQLGAALQPDPWTPPPPIYEELRQRLVQRDTFQHMRQQELNRLHTLDQRPQIVASVRERSQKLIAYLETQMKQLDLELEAALHQEGEWAEAAKRLLSIPGIGAVTAAWLLVGTVNFSLCENAKQLTAYAGLAPYPFQSGTSVHKRSRIGYAGQSRLRRALYMAAVTAIRFNPPLLTFYQRLKANDKPSKVAVCAVARKLLCICFALVTKQRMFDPHFGTLPAVSAA